MSEHDADRLGPLAGEGQGAGWFSYAPAGASDDDAERPAIRKVHLRQDEHAGPFWSDQGHLSEDFGELHQRLGISRELYDDAMAWNDDLPSSGSAPTGTWEREHFARQQELLRRLGHEVHSGIEVDLPRAEPPTLVQLSRLNVDASGSHLLLWDEGAVETGRATVLPPTPEALIRRARAWVAALGQHEEATGENDAAIFQWEDEGFAIAQELQTHLGDGFRVVAR